MGSERRKDVLRLIDDGPGSACWNMGLDEALLESVTQGSQPPTLRLYRWQNLDLSVGRFQSLKRTIDRSACDRLGVTIVRRITGGRGILHGDDLTISLVMGYSALVRTDTVSIGADRIYTLIAPAFISMFRNLGIQAAMGHPVHSGRLDGQGDCFRLVSRADIVDAVSGRKLLGAALCLREGCFLLQASVPLHSAERAERLRAVAAAVFDQGAVSPSDPGARLFESALTSSLLKGVEESLDLCVSAGEADADERIRARQLVRSRYEVLQWTVEGLGQSTAAQN